MIGTPYESLISAPNCQAKRENICPLSERLAVLRGDEEEQYPRRADVRLREFIQRTIMLLLGLLFIVIGGSLDKVPAIIVFMPIVIKLTSLAISARCTREWS